jgi:hypothetical protein
LLAIESDICSQQQHRKPDNTQAFHILASWLNDVYQTK